MKKLRWVADPVKLATDPGIGRFRGTDRGEGNPARAAVAAALKAGKPVVTPTRRYCAAWFGACGSAEKRGVALNFEQPLRAPFRSSDTARGLAEIPSSASTAFSTAPAITC